MPGAREVIGDTRVFWVSSFCWLMGASQNAVFRVQNTRLAVARSSLTISLTIPWAALDMAHEAAGFKAKLSGMVSRGQKFNVD
jgi:hypothetical protein